MVVWRADLYQTEALRQLSDTSFYAKVDKDLTSTNQQIVKSTINDLIVKQELPATATNLIITTPRTAANIEGKTTVNRWELTNNKSKMTEQ